MRLWLTAIGFAVGVTLAGNAAGQHEVPPRQGNLRVATLNVHYIFDGQQRLAWEPRADAVVAALRAIDADIVGFQEMETFAGGSSNASNRQLDTIRAAFDQYRVVAAGDPSRFPNTQPLLVRSERFTVLREGFFFFSPEPDRLYSRQWNGRPSYYAVWAELHDRASATTLFVVNLHLDHSSVANRVRSTRLVRDRVGSLAASADALVIMGDFNSPGVGRPRRLARDLDLSVAPRNGASFHFNRGVHLVPAVDHIVYSASLQLHGSATVRARPDGVWPSDHHPVLADFTILNR